MFRRFTQITFESKEEICALIALLQLYENLLERAKKEPDSKDLLLLELKDLILEIKKLF